MKALDKLNKQAEDLRQVEREQEQFHKECEQAWKDWQRENPPTDATQKKLNQATDRESNARQKATEERAKLEDAFRAFNEAYAAYMQALGITIFR